MPQDTQILLRVDSDTKDRWEHEVVDSEDYSPTSMAAAIRYAMHQTFFVECEDGDDDEDTQRVSADVDLSPIEERLADIDESIARFRAEMEAELGQNWGAADDFNLASSIYNKLARVDTPDRLPPLTEAMDMRVTTHRMSHCGTVDQIANSHGVSKERVYDALEIVTETHDDVETVEEFGHDRYYRLHPDLSPRETDIKNKYIDEVPEVFESNIDWTDPSNRE